MKYALPLALLLALTSCSDAPQWGDTPSLQSFEGQWVVINYWARWCKPCIEEIPELNEVDRRYDAVTVLGVNYDGLTGEALQAEAVALGVAFHQLEHDPSGELGVPRPVVLPTTLIVAPNGEHHATLVGPQTIASLAEATGHSK